MGPRLNISAFELCPILSKRLICLAPRAEVPWPNEINSLEWPTYRSGTIEPQKLFPAVANRKMLLKFIN